MADFGGETELEAFRGEARGLAGWASSPRRAVRPAW